MSNKKIVKEIMDFLDPKKNKENHIDEIIEIIKQSKNVKEAHNELMKKFGISEQCAYYVLTMKLRELYQYSFTKPEFVFIRLYNTKRGHEAFIKLCKSNKLSKLNNIDFVKKYESKIKANPEGLYKLVLKTYPNRGYVTNMKLIKEIYFEAFKLV